MIDIEISCRIIYVNHIYIFYKKRQGKMKQIFRKKLIAHKNDTRININNILHCYITTVYLPPFPGETFYHTIFQRIT